MGKCIFWEAFVHVAHSALEGMALAVVAGVLGGRAAGYTVWSVAVAAGVDIVGASADCASEIVGARIADMAVLLAFVTEEGLSDVFPNGDALFADVEAVAEESVPNLGAVYDSCGCGK